MLEMITPQIVQFMFEKSPEACIVILLITSLARVGIPAVNLFKKLTDSISDLNTEVVKLNTGLENVTKAVDAHKDATEAKFNKLDVEVAIIKYGLDDLKKTVVGGTQNGGNHHGSNHHP